MEQRLRAGGILDVLTKDELSECMGHNFDTAIRELYRGLDYLSFSGTTQSQPNGLFTIPVSPQSGYTWSVKIVSVQVTSGGAVSVLYVGTSSLVPAVGGASVQGINNDYVFSFGSNTLVIKDGQSLSVFPGSSNAVLAWHVRVLQVPTEMQGKL